jgi:LCP family protein required for cell wall assembly
MFIIGGSYMYLNNAGNIIQDPGFDAAIDDQPELAPPEAAEDIIINTLLMGVDEGRSDTIIVVRYNKNTHQIAMISIPRDTRVDIPGYGYEKVNAAIGKKGGAALAMKTVGNLLDIPIHHYVKVDFRGVEKIVDILGGVKIDVPPGMDYEDPAQNLYIHLKPGVQVLNGKDSLKFLRFRSGYVDQDLGRIKAQQKFINAFIDKLTSPSVILKAPTLINTMVENVRTNMEQEDIAAYILDIGEINTDKITMQTLPGEGKYVGIVSYFIHDQDKLDEMMDGIDQQLGVQKPQDNQDVSTAADGQGQGVEKEQIKIEILNSTDTSGLAGALKKELEEKGYVVEKIGDTKDLTYSYSRVVDRKGDKEKLELLSKDSGISIVESDINANHDYDITIIIGNDRT